MNGETKARIMNGGIAATRVATPSGIALAIFLLWRLSDKLEEITLALHEVLVHVRLHGVP